MSDPCISLASLDGLIERFETSARAGRAPAIESVLHSAGALDQAERKQLLVELIAIDLEYRWQSPHRRGPLVELYVKRLGVWGTLDDVPLELVTEEYRARQRFGDRPPHAEYAARFPRHGQQLLAELARIDEELAGEYPAAPRAPPGATASSARPASDPDAPLDYRDYAIRRLIAAGGMSRVYTAVQKSLQKPVALKVLNKDLSRDARDVRRFVREARIAAALDMPGAVGAWGLGRFPDGGYFMVLRLIDGPDLTRLPNRLPFDEDRALHLIRGIAAVVAQLHDRGWLHCDLKPSNVLLDSRGEPWLTDFAMAQPWNLSHSPIGDDHHFALGGTPAFMAPEQFAGDAALLSPATDIFALGGICTYLLLGTLQRNADAELLNQRTPRCADVVRCCLAEQPEARFQSCSELLAAISRL